MAELPCQCSEMVALRAELAAVKRERDYLLEFADPKEVVAMRRELAAEFEANKPGSAT